MILTTSALLAAPLLPEPEPPLSTNALPLALGAVEAVGLFEIATPALFELTGATGLLALFVAPPPPILLPNELTVPDVKTPLTTPVHDELDGQQATLPLSSG